METQAVGNSDYKLRLVDLFAKVVATLFLIACPAFAVQVQIAQQ